MTEIRRCWADNWYEWRCDLEAGHEGDHETTMTWSDEEAQ